jgi:hypothetical protein
MLLEKRMLATISCMKDTEQVRIPKRLTDRARVIATTIYSESLPEYVARVLEEAVNRELPAARDKIDEQIREGQPGDAPKRKRS